jgi:hypothetical protein
MSWTRPTREQWMQIGFTALLIVAVISTVLIVVTRLR